MKTTKIFMASAFAAAAMFIAGCDKTKEYDVITPASQAHFMNATIGTYYVKNDPTSVYKIPVGLTQPAAANTPVSVTVTSPTGATSGAQYTLGGTTATIAAGKTSDSLSVKGIFAGFPGTRVDTLVFNIQNGAVPQSDYNSTYKLVLRKFCDVILSSFNGNYTKAYDKQAGQPDYGPYAVTFSNPVLLTATTGTIKINNFWDVGTSVVVNLDWTNPANFITTIPSQFLYTDPTYGAATISSVGTGSFSSCDNTFSFSYTVRVAAGSFGNFTTPIAR